MMRRPTTQTLRERSHACAVGLTIAMFVLSLIVIGGGPVLAGSGMRDPFVASPFGPFAFTDNPASVLYEDEVAVKMALSLEDRDGHSSSTLTYVEPNQGFGAGALYYKTTSAPGDVTHHTIGYIVADRGSRNIDYGWSIKRVGTKESATWAVDVGMLSRIGHRWKFGMTAHNIYGRSEFNPLNVTGALAYQILENGAFAASISSPSITDKTNMELGIGVDLHLRQQSKLRIGRVIHAESGRGYWLGSFSTDVGSLIVDFTVWIGQEDQENIAIGIKYQF